MTNFHVHKQAISDINDFRKVLRLPHRADDVSLSLICQSIDRLVCQGLDRVQNDYTRKCLHCLDIQLLNSFQAGMTSQDPVQQLD